MSVLRILNASTGHLALDSIVLLLAAVCVICPLTFLYTYIRFQIDYRNGGQGAKKLPPTLPYWIPYLGSALSMRSPHQVFIRAQRWSGDGRPIRIVLGPASIILLHSPRTIAQVFKNSKNMIKGVLTEQIFKGCGGVPPADLETIKRDKSGYGAKPAIPIADHQRFWKNTHDLHGVYLSTGPSVTDLTTKFLEEFNRELQEEPLGQWNTMPIFDFMRERMVIASATAFTGSALLKLTPGWAKLYWEYDEAFLSLALDFPRFMNPKAYDARERMVDAAVKWLEFADANYDWDNDKDPAWEELYGSRYFRKIVRVLQYSGLTTRGQAASLLVQIWATHSNAVPASIWAMIELVQRPELLSRVHEEIKTSIDPVTNTIDVPKLVALPLLNSIYQELLRTRSSTTVTRSTVEAMTIDGYHIPADSILIASSWMGSMESSSWSSFGASVSEFDPERFLNINATKNDPDAPAAEKAKAAALTRPESFFPYGGGLFMCPGRWFAKQEILGAVATMVTTFDIEFQGYVNMDGAKSERGPQIQPGYEGAGFMPPDRDLMVRLRRR